MRPKKSSRAYIKAINRFAGLKSIDPQLDPGNGLTIAALEHQITEFQNVLNDYNAALSTLDAKTQRIRDAEKLLNDSCERWLAAVISKYGKDSEEYQKAGGVRKSLRKKNGRKTVPPAEADLSSATSRREL